VCHLLVKRPSCGRTNGGPNLAGVPLLGWPPSVQANQQISVAHYASKRHDPSVRGRHAAFCVWGNMRLFEPHVLSRGITCTKPELYGPLKLTPSFRVWSGSSWSASIFLHRIIVVLLAPVG
jgi:hypothetical protein